MIQRSIGKITPATIGCKPIAAMVAADGKERKAATIYAQANGLKAVTDVATGQVFTALTGIFQAESSADVHYASGVCYMPGGTHEMVVHEVEKIMYEVEQQNANREPGSKPVDPSFIEFAVELWAVSAKNKAGYSWEVRDVADIGRIDPLASLKNRVNSALLEHKKQGTIVGKRGQVIDA